MFFCLVGGEEAAGHRSGSFLADLRERFLPGEELGEVPAYMAGIMCTAEGGLSFYTAVAGGLSFFFFLIRKQFFLDPVWNLDLILPVLWIRNDLFRIRIQL